MIRVLEDWAEIGVAYHRIQDLGLPPHRSPEKNWDLSLLHSIIRHEPRTAKVLDLGCGGLETLWFLRALGFENLWGIDLNINRRDRVNQLVTTLRAGTVRPLLHLRRGDIMGTPFGPHSFEVLTSLSVLEHGVEAARLLAEARRLLRDDGLLFVTADYWETRVDTEGIRPFGLPWNIQSKADVEVILSTAADFGFAPLEDNLVPPCKERCVSWAGKHYTFIMVALRAKGN